jgi:hypothetical protein
VGDFSTLSIAIFHYNNIPIHIYIGNQKVKKTGRNQKKERIKQTKKDIL